MDDFTRNHLATYADHICFDDEREGFIAYVEEAVKDDPGLENMGWPGMLKMYRRKVDAQ
jgi:hypothetical protein